MLESGLLRLAKRSIPVLPLIALLLLLGTPSRAAAGFGAGVFDINTTVPVGSMDVFPPNPCSEGIRVTGNFQLQAHIVIPPGSPAPGPMHVTLHLNANEISGTGLTTGAPYVGGEGGTASLNPASPTFPFQSDLLLKPVPGPNHNRLNPCKVRASFMVTVFSSLSGLGMSASLANLGPTLCGWSPLGTGMNDWVDALAVDGSGILYAGGNFTSALPLTGISAPMYVARWNGSSWSALGSGMNSAVRALVVDGSGNLYAGGGFTALAGGGGVNHIAEWTGGFWYGLGSGVNDAVYALAVDASGDLYAGGFFTTAGGTSANYVAKWNGSNWSALGGGMNAAIFALAVDGSGNLYAGGNFTTAGGVSANYVAKWNGSSWSALGSGMDASVWALAVDGSGNVYAGGTFATAGGKSANYVAKWNGKSWSALGSGINNGTNNTVRALALGGSGNLYAGGTFLTAGGVSVKYVAAWNGSGWSALDGGVNAPVFALAVRATRLYAGGYLTSAGGNPAAFIARWC